MSDRESMSRTLGEMRKDMARFRPIEDELLVRKAEDKRLSELAVALRQEVGEATKDIEERTRQLPYLVEQHNHNNKRIVQLQQENIELFKRVEESGSKLQLLEQKQQKIESQTQALPPVVDNLKRSQEQFIDSLKLADVDRQRQMKEWGAVFDEQQAAVDEQRKRLVEFGATNDEARRSIAAIARFQEQLQRDQNQVAELQRLAEDRQRKEMSNFLAENEKRWKKQTLEWDYQWDQQGKTNVDFKDRFPVIAEQLTFHDNLLQFLWRFVEAQGNAQLTAAQKWLDEVQKLAAQRQGILKVHEEAKFTQQ